MVGWHHWLNGHEFEQTLGDGGQGSLACCSLWGCKELDTAVWLNRERLPFSMSQVIDLQLWPGDQGCCREEFSFPAPQARRFLRPIDCPFIKDRSENEGKFPTYNKCLEIFFLTIVLSSNLSLWLLIYYILNGSKKSALSASRNRCFTWDFKETVADNLCLPKESHR